MVELLADIVVGLATARDSITIESSALLEHTMIEAKRTTINCTRAAVQTMVGPQTMAVVRTVVVTVTK